VVGEPAVNVIASPFRVREKLPAIRSSGEVRRVTLVLIDRRETDARRFSAIRQNRFRLLPFNQAGSRQAIVIDLACRVNATTDSLELLAKTCVPIADERQSAFHRRKRGLLSAGVATIFLTESSFSSKGKCPSHT